MYLPIYATNHEPPEDVLLDALRYQIMVPL